jgi:hypothetical protein
MSPKRPTANLAYLENFTSRKVERVSARLVGTAPDSLAAWIERYLTLAVVGVRSEEVIKKVTLHLQRFVAFYKKATATTASPGCSSATCWPGSRT